MSETEAVNEIMQRIRSKMQESHGDGQAPSESQGTQSFERAMERIGQQLKNTPLPTAVTTDTPDAVSGGFTVAAQEASQLETETSNALTAHREFGKVNPRPSGLHNRVIQLVKQAMRRSLTWYTRPLHLFQGAVVRAFQQVTSVLQAHDESLQKMAREHGEQNNRIVEQMAAQRVAILAIAEELFQAGGRFEASVTGQPGGSQLLKENKRIVSYWDRAAEGDALRETVSQGAKESDEEYLNNWVRIGEYVAGKIMSYSRPSPVALEIGPGMGRISAPMSRYCKSITALDISPEMVRQARETLKELPNFEVQLITDEDLSFLPSEQFDLAYAISCFQHADKKSFYRYLRGMRRALRPDGVLFFGVLNLCSERGWGHFEAIVENDYPEFFHTPDEISAYLKHAGYSSHQLEYEGETLWAIAHP